jgi:hypothetical protein
VSVVTLDMCATERMIFDTSVVDLVSYSIKELINTEYPDIFVYLIVLQIKVVFLSMTYRNI